MQGFEVIIGHKNQHQDNKNIRMIKKRRSKRPRHHDTAATSSLSSSNNSNGFGEIEDEEDMASCLMLLSRGKITKPQPPSAPLPPPSPPAAPPCVASAGVNKEAYECKTCNRIFPSFQSLGGHRASHRRPKQGEDDVTISLSLRVPTEGQYRNFTNKSARVHECSICGAEFSSGQALGGHMRRHRPPAPPIAAAGENSGSHDETTLSSDRETKKPRHVLGFDLNLPAPEDDHREMTSFPFPAKEQVIVFSAASHLVDCHY